MRSPHREPVAIPGQGPAASYARELLAALAVPTRDAPGAVDTDPALAWATSGAMALTGRPNRPPRVPRGPVACAAIGAARALTALGGRAPDDPAALLGERAALTGLGRRGDVSVGGSCRLMRASDGFAALNLARPDDAAALPAWLEATLPAHLDLWEFAVDAVRRRPLAELARRAQWIGLPFAPAAREPATLPWLRRHAVGATRPEPKRPPRVLDFSALWAGPLCGALLAASGAEVIKVESRQRPDGARAGSAPFFALHNAGKSSVALDLDDDGDRALLAALVDAADVVIESTRPRALAQWGIDAEGFLTDRHGRVWLGITGYGRDDEAPGRVAFGDDAAVAGGLAWSVADDDGPLFCGDAIADPLTGLHAAVAALASWRGGGGELLDLSLSGVAAHAVRGGEETGCEVEGDAHAAWVRVADERRAVAVPRARPVLRDAAPLGADTETWRSTLLPRRSG